ncbi:MAG: DNA gyrase inhibitor YacG [Nitrospirota bacterium]|nr:DNA gyrase inhibitor YacG [Nitrospirota bacterium]
MKYYLCPACKKPALVEENPFRPFCSERCKLLDLYRWMSEEYRIEGAENGRSSKNKPERA